MYTQKVRLALFDPLKSVFIQLLGHILVRIYMLSPVLIGGFVEMDRALLRICPIRSRRDFRTRSFFDNPPSN